jgi:DNA-binding Lrp family transcriptional regulator
LEVTLLEAIDGWDRYVELSPDAATRRFLELLKNPRVNIRKLAKASRTEPPRVRERLRALLEAGGWGSEAAGIEPARSKSSRSRALRVVRTPVH